VSSTKTTTGANPMKDYTITVDILEAVQDFYPGLPAFQAEIIAEKIIDKWDYTGEYNKIADEISWYADALDIDLEGKDGVEIPEDNIYVLNPPPSRLFP
tara:strand:- start:227 stop:523 length:297 start_codon:yes stop_codon:yes gene_type:complete